MSEAVRESYFCYPKMYVSSTTRTLANFGDLSYASTHSVFGLKANCS
jgi:hypothetical protein